MVADLGPSCTRVHIGIKKEKGIVSYLACCGIEQVFKIIINKHLVFLRFIFMFTI